MKKYYRRTALLLCALLLWGCTGMPGGDTSGTGSQPPALQTTGPSATGIPEEVTAAEDMKGMWLSQFDLAAVYTDGGKQRGQADFTALMETILDNVAAQGCNAIFLQIRPNADSMYPSRIYPMSRFVVGQYGREAEYDPVKIVISLAHARGLEVHAWINPLRGMKEAELEQVSDTYVIRQWVDDPETRGNYTVLYNGTWYLNPAYEAVRELIVEGAREALAQYDFDGLHMDDYFYPTQDAAFDREVFASYEGELDLAGFRREALNALVAALYKTAHEAGVVFGISPAGMLDQVYSNQYADVYTWCSEPGYIDYICPQAYFGLEHENYDFVSVCQSYDEIITYDGVKLYIGMSLGKALAQEDRWAGTGKYEWRDRQDILKRSLETTLELEHCAGVVIFCYQYFYDPVTGEEVAGTEAERAAFIPCFREITWE